MEGKGHEWLESDPRRLQISPGLRYFIDIAPDAGATSCWKI